MDILSRILIGLVIAAVGVAVVFYSQGIVDFFGDVEWADRHLGSSQFFYKLVGVCITLIGFLVMTDLWNTFLAATVGKILFR